MSRKFLSFDPSDAYGIAYSYQENSGIDIPVKALNELVSYIVETLDFNLQLASSFWNPDALVTYMRSTRALPHLASLDENQTKLVHELLPVMGLSIFGKVFSNGLFVKDKRDTFPYIVIDVNNAMVVLEEDSHSL